MGVGKDGVPACRALAVYQWLCVMFSVFVWSASHPETGGPSSPPFVYKGPEVQMARVRSHHCGIFPSAASEESVPCEVWKVLSVPATVACFCCSVLNFLKNVVKHLQHQTAHFCHLDAYNSAAILCDHPTPHRRDVFIVPHRNFSLRNHSPLAPSPALGNLVHSVSRKLLLGIS